MRRDGITTADGVRLAYFDTGGSGPALLCLHGHFRRASTFARAVVEFLESRVAPDAFAPAR